MNKRTLRILAYKSMCVLILSMHDDVIHGEQHRGTAGASLHTQPPHSGPRAAAVLVVTILPNIYYRLPEPGL